jgi:N-acyl homoserine lactone hydrolase
MGARHLYILPSGYLSVDKSILTAGRDMGIKVQVPCYSALVRTDDGDILIDTGLNPQGLTEPDKAWGPRAKLIKPSITAEDDVRNRLAQLGIRPQDLRCVVITHLHWDHTGALRFFTDVPILVQKAEYRFAFYPDRYLSSPYMRNHFDHPLHYELIEGDQEIVPGVAMVLAAGHTPGQAAVIVNLAETGTVILASDAVYVRENIDQGVPPGNCWSPPHAIESIHRLALWEKMAGGLLIPGHDPVVWPHVRKAPEYYQ